MVEVLVVDTPQNNDINLSETVKKDSDQPAYTCLIISGLKKNIFYLGDFQDALSI